MAIASELARKAAARKSSRSDGEAGPRTLAIDIGGTGLKALVLDAAGTAVTERARVETPRPATTDAVIAALVELVAKVGPFDRVSVGFPGVVVGGATRTAVNLDPSWKNFELKESLETRLKRPVRVLNDAGVQGFGVIDGKGVEMVLTFGTGMGTALYVDGRYVPNLELAHHPFDGKRTYEEYVGGKAFEKVGKKKWNKRVARVVAQVNPIWNPRRLYLGGGNAKHLRIDLPSNARITDNVAGLLGGIKLWEMEPDRR
ncbi:MAG: chromosome partitioning protein ParA [Labilithrix sp.]|nr:chromosome partitioning protein ParA [Labilithrix sp.]